nr:MAG TPA: hypothetical protein [Bacteriophage sp.]
MIMLILIIKIMFATDCLVTLLHIYNRKYLKIYFIIEILLVYTMVRE